MGVMVYIIIEYRLGCYIKKEFENTHMVDLLMQEKESTAATSDVLWSRTSGNFKHSKLGIHPLTVLSI